VLAGSVHILVTGMGITKFPGFLSLPGFGEMLNTGVCGAVRPGFHTGEVVMPALVRAFRGDDEITLPSGNSGRLVTVKEPVLSPAEKLAIPGEFVDMECFPQAFWAGNEKIPFHCLKVISDTVGTETGISAHVSSLGAVLPVLTESVEKLVKNLVEKGV